NEGGGGPTRLLLNFSGECCEARPGGQRRLRANRLPIGNGARRSEAAEAPEDNDRKVLRRKAAATSVRAEARGERLHEVAQRNRCATRKVHSGAPWRGKKTPEFIRSPSVGLNCCFKRWLFDPGQNRGAHDEGVGRRMPAVGEALLRRILRSVANLSGLRYKVRLAVREGRAGRHKGVK